MDVQLLDHAIGKPAFELVAGLMAGKFRQQICPIIDPRDEAASKASAQLNALQRTAKAVYEERGSQDLYVGYPIVEGKLLDDQPIRCPLLFFPVKLERKDRHWTLLLRPDGVLFNKALLLALQQFNLADQALQLADAQLEDFPADARAFLTALYRTTEEAKLGLRPQASLFEERLEPLVDIQKKTFVNTRKTGELQLLPQAVMGIFPQADSALTNDYHDLLHKTGIKDIESFFGSDGQFIAERDIHRTVTAKAHNEEELLTPFPLDASQEEALRLIKSGSSLVVQGPPGSGKSQLICNLIADQIGRGRKVLVVCQKRAALDVVHERLSQQELQQFTGLIHDFRNDRKAIFEQINEQIQQISHYQSQNSSLNTIHLQREYNKTSRRIDEITTTLEEFRQALFTSEECGLSAKELYLSCSSAQPHINLRTEYLSFHFSTYDTFLRKMKSYTAYAFRFNTPSGFWASRKSFANKGIGHLKALQEAVRQVAPFSQQLLQQSAAFVPTAKHDPDRLDRLEAQIPQFEQLMQLLSNEHTYQIFKHVQQQGSPDTLWLNNMRKNLMAAFSNSGIEQSLEQDQLMPTLELLQKAHQMQQNWFLRLQWRLFYSKRPEVTKLLLNNRLENTAEGVATLMERIDNRTNLEHNLSSMYRTSRMFDKPEGLQKQQIDRWLLQHFLAIEAAKSYNQLTTHLNLPLLNTFKQFTSALQGLLGVAQQYQLKKLELLELLSARQLTTLLAANETPEAYLRELDANFDELVEFDTLRESFTTAEGETIKKLHAELGEWNYRQMQQLFDNSLRLSWLQHLETKYPVLRMGSTKTLPQLEEELQEAVLQKRQLCKQIVLMRVKEHTYQDVEVNRLNNRVTYRDLQHQTTKKRMLWPLRKLFAEFSHELMDLVPCWLASPETVSAVFPMEPVFDLVIFDEASQCYAERAIPAMYRARQVVISGDTQQLPPSSLYQTRWQGEEDDEPDLEVDSLLDLSLRYLGQISLTGHYRSQFPELIAFSNKHFYGNSLRFIPDISAINQPKPAIHYQYVLGIWENQRNTREAEEVVQLVEELLAGGETSIGIVTLNFQQQELIQDLIEQHSKPWLFDNVLLKNLENIQGDERDIIIISVGYAPDINGRVRAQFGLLSMAGGENRLNVAITRAQKAMYIVASFMPEQLDVAHVLNDGPKLLKSFLAFANDVSENGYRWTPEKSLHHNPEWYLNDRLLQLPQLAGMLSKTLPFADLAMREDGRYKGALLTDDNAYFTARSAKDQHVYLPRELQRKGWHYLRVYSRTYWRFTDEMEQRLKHYIEEVEEG